MQVCRNWLYLKLAGEFFSSNFSFEKTEGLIIKSLSIKIFNFLKTKREGMKGEGMKGEGIKGEGMKGEG